MKPIFLIASFFLNFFNAQYLKVEYERIELNELENRSMSKEYKEKVNTTRKIPQKNFLYYANGNSFFKNIPRADFIHDVGTTQIDESNKRRKKEVFKDFPGVILSRIPDYILTAIKVSNDSKENDVEKIYPKLKVYKGEEYKKNARGQGNTEQAYY
ncbi:hypothetical protein ACM39_17605 [Chryseobacterium sp. FH2]|uniref:hypothetical protein n=1 Tax=Chryseobacterium sp. FH2 TaxID=1674291 RepID=UPI00065AD769|nr:hypothetical protein [Chryseobacterium sp. FH2]KMQ62925.1 hypothetical protein ACM39_17605 [Chryseobacterium sp. FH2]